MKKGTELKFANPEPRLIAAMISGISGLCQALKNDDLSTEEVRKAISDFKDNKDAIEVFKLLVNELI